MRLSGPLVLLLACVPFAACGRSGLQNLEPGPTPSPTSTANPTGALRLISVASATAQIRPGQFGVTVQAMVTNTAAVAVDTAAVSLRFGPAGARDGDFRRREASLWTPPIGAGQSVTVDFEVDVQAWAGTDPVEFGGRVDYLQNGLESTNFAETTDDWTFASMVELVVNTTSDIDDLQPPLSLREAILLANATEGTADRIRFDPAVFPSDIGGKILLFEELPEVQAVGGPLVIDGSGARVILEPDVSIEETGEWMFRTNGEVTISGLVFSRPGILYEEFDLTNSNCEGGTLTGGSVQIRTGPATVLAWNEFDDAGVAERNCNHRTIDMIGDGAHRIVDNDFRDLAGDAVNTSASFAEFSRNRVLRCSDDAIHVLSAGGATVRIAGNLFVDTELSPVLVGGGSIGKIELWNNTFVRSGLAGLRTFSEQQIEIANGAFLDNAPAALELANQGAGVTITHSTHSGSPRCSTSCGNMIVDAPTVNDAPLQFANGDGDDWADFLPLAGSPLLDAGLDLLDRNGSTPGRFHGVATDQGAVEAPATAQAVTRGGT